MPDDSTVQKAVAKECPTGGQIGRSTMGDIQGRQEANHKNQNQKIKKQGAGKNRGRAKTKAGLIRDPN